MKSQSKDLPLDSSLSPRAWRVKAPMLSFVPKVKVRAFEPSMANSVRHPAARLTSFARRVKYKERWGDGASI